MIFLVEKICFFYHNLNYLGSLSYTKGQLGGTPFISKDMLEKFENTGKEHHFIKENIINNVILPVLKNYDISYDNEFIVNHGYISPGHFWCEYFEGTHYSIDYKRTDQPKGSLWAWEPFCTMVGEKEENNLTKFTKWEVVNPPRLTLPRFICEIDDVEFLNIECIDDKIFEIHLRTGNDVLHRKPVGTEAIPIWDDEQYKIKILEEQGYTFKGNHHPDSFKYNAHGLLSDLRIGYMIK